MFNVIGDFWEVRLNQVVKVACGSKIEIFHSPERQPDITIIITERSQGSEFTVWDIINDEKSRAGIFRQENKSCVSLQPLIE